MCDEFAANFAVTHIECETRCWPTHAPRVECELNAHTFQLSWDPSDPRMGSEDRASRVNPNERVAGCGLCSFLLCSALRVWLTALHSTPLEWNGPFKRDEKARESRRRSISFPFLPTECNPMGASAEHKNGGCERIK